MKNIETKLQQGLYIEHSNTDIRKLYKLANNGFFSKKTIDKLITVDYNNKLVIVFNSKQTLQKYKKFEFSSLAMF